MRIALACVLALGVLAAPGGAQPRPPVDPNPLALKALPAIPVGPVLNGTAAQFDWKAHPGKIVLLDFFSYTCKPCLKAMPDLVKLQEAHKDRLQILGYHIGRGGTAEVEPLVKKFALNYPVAVPPDWENTQVPIPGGDFLAAFGMEMLPTTALVDAKGKLRHWGLAPDEVEPKLKALLAE